MGKNRQAQRTKNNTKPSSSSRSAELLGKTMPNFVGFSTLPLPSDEPSSSSHTTELLTKTMSNFVAFSGRTISKDELEMFKDSNFLTVLKKMSKKDATTRYKALQEFATLCQSAELPVVKGALPSWSRLYCTLSIDIDNKVREAAQLAHAVIVKRVNKDDITTYLKQLVGVWYTSQYDTYPPAASAAINSFNSTFPCKKFDVIVPYQCDILSYISNNIIEQTAETLTMQRTFTSDEMETIYQRVLVANLQGYSSYFKEFELRLIDKNLEIQSKILSSPKFWLLSRHNSSPIKTAFFNVLSSIIEKAQILLQNQKKRTLDVIIKNLDESEPEILSAVWESMLLVTQKIDDWHLVVNINGFLLPKLWRVLRSGGQCCASIVYPHLLPFVSQFPKLSTDTNDLYMAFFDNMRQGFSAKSIQMSRTEMQALTKSFIECLRYSILANAKNVDLCIQLFKKQLMPVIEACMTGNTRMKELFFPKIVRLVRYWSLNRANEEYKSYVSLMQQFWIELRLLFDKFMNISQKLTTSCSIIEATGTQIEFLLILKTPPPDPTDKKLKVKFSDPNNSVVDQRPEVKPINEVDRVFSAELCEFVNKLGTIYFAKVNDQQSKGYMKQLNKLIEHFASKELFVAILESSEVNDDFEFYDKMLMPFLLKNSEIMEEVLELIFYFIRYINDSEKEKILKSLMELNDVAIAINVIRCSLSERNRNDQIIKKWYTETSITRVLIDIAKKMVSPEHKELEKHKNLTLLPFKASEMGDLLINEEEIRTITSILCDSIRGIDNTCFIQFIEFMTELMISIWDHEQTISSALQILEALFEIYIRLNDSQDHEDIDLVSSATAVHNGWKKGFVKSSQVLSPSEFNDLIKRWAIIIWRQVHSACTVKDILVDLSADILDVIINNNGSIESDYIEEIILIFLTASDIRSWVAEVTAVAIYGEIVAGNTFIYRFESPIRIFQDDIPLDLKKDIVSDKMVTCLSWATFTTNLINNLYKRLKSSQVNISENTELCNWDLPGIIEILVNIMHVAAIAEMYQKNYKFTRYYDDVNKLLDSFNNSFVNLQQHFSKDLQCEVLYQMQSKLQSYGYMLPYLIRTYYAKFKPNENPIKTFYEGFRYSKIHDQQIYMQGINLLNDHCTPEDIPLIPETDDIYRVISARLMVYLENDDSMYISVLNDIMNYSYLKLVQLADISTIHLFDVELAVEIIKLCMTLVRKIPSELTTDYWDFIILSLLRWLDSVAASKRNGDYTNTKVIALMIAVCQLFYELQILMNKHEQEPISELIAKVYYNWKNRFAYNIYNRFAGMWILYADLYNKDETIRRSTIALDYLGKAISMFNKNISKTSVKESVKPYEAYKKFMGEPENVERGNEEDAEISPLTSDEDCTEDTVCSSHKKSASKKPDISTETVSFDTMLNSEKQIKFLQSSIPSIQLGAYHALKCTVSELVQHDKALVKTDKYNIKNSLYMKKFELALLNMQSIVNTMFIEFKSCDTVSCTIQPFTDSYTYTLGYLLTWAIVLDFCACADSDLRYEYTEILKVDLFPCLLKNIFKLMPVEILQDKNKNVKLREMFNITPSFNFGENWTERRLDHIVCWLYTNCLRHLPVLVRQWWSTADSKVGAIIEKITSDNISPMLCQEELVTNRLSITNMKVKVHPTAREVMALYQMDDTKLELTIVLPPNYPLGTVMIEPGQYADIANWKNCHKQLSIFLTHQNGSIWQGLKMWKRNLDKKFAGVEECCICFSIFHISTHQIPKVSCKTCRKKFHTICVYKWFQTSQKASCPTCRDEYNL